MRNSDYTCDLCQAQISEREAFVLNLGKMISTRSDPRTFLRYDLCERCAEIVNEKVRQQLGIEEDG